MLSRIQKIEQLNQERKRRENRVWEEWFTTEQNKRVTSEKLKARTNALNQIRDEYEKALIALNNTPEAELDAKNIKTQNDRISTSTLQSTPTTQSQLVNTGRLDSAIYAKIREKQYTDEVVKNNETQKKQVGQEIDLQRFTNYNALQQLNETLQQQKEKVQIELEETVVKEVSEVLQKYGFSIENFLNDIPGLSKKDKILHLVEEGSRTPYSFPVFLLSVALLIDVAEIIPTAINAIPAVGQVLSITISTVAWISKMLIFMPILFFATFGTVNFAVRRVMRKYLINTWLRKGVFVILGLFIEVTPLIGSLWPGTFIFTLFLVNAKTTAGLLLQEIAKVVKKYE